MVIRLSYRVPVFFFRKVDINLEQGAKKFMSMKLAFSSKSAKMVEVGICNSSLILESLKVWFTL